MTRDPRTWPRWPLALAVLTIAAGALRLFALASTPPTSDDLKVVATAFDFVERGHYGATMWQHPKLRDLLTYASIQTFGDGVWGLKLPSLLLGTASIPLLAVLVRRLLASEAVALLAALLLAVDPVHVLFSREAIQEVHGPAFTLLGLIVLLAYRADRTRLHLAALGGVVFGLSLAAKWHGVFPLAVVAAFLAAETLRARGLPAREKISELAFLSVALLAVPATVYLVTYLPWFVARGYGLGDWVAAQRLMAAENLVHQGFNPYLMEFASSARDWFVRPVAWAEFVLARRTPTVFLACSNPLVWMLTLPAAVALGVRAYRSRAAGDVLAASLFWAAYLPLAVATRPIWVNSSLAVTPFAFALVAWGLVTATRRLARPSVALAAYTGAVLLVALPLYALAIGAGFDSPLLRPIVESMRPANEQR